MARSMALLIFILLLLLVLHLHQSPAHNQFPQITLDTRFERTRMKTTNTVQVQEDEKEKDEENDVRLRTPLRKHVFCRAVAHL